MTDNQTAVTAIAERFPDTPTHTRAGLAAMNWDKPLAQVDRADMARKVLARYEAGETMREIADSIGLAAADQLYRLVLDQCPDDWRAYQSARALGRYERSMTQLETAQDGLGLSRAREVARFTSWELERLQRRLYGQDAPQINVAGDGVTIQVMNYRPQGTEP